jgi:hypothetical protein
MSVLDRLLRRLGVVRASTLARKRRQAGAESKRQERPAELAWADTVKLKPMPEVPARLAEGTLDGPVEAVPEGRGAGRPAPALTPAPGPGPGEPAGRDFGRADTDPGLAVRFPPSGRDE